ncbi:MAG TPA: phage tail protein [Vicinamibacterales bacterium]|nr:phage tail protein [Vicinamibacterales bacterium]
MAATTTIELDAARVEALLKQYPKRAQTATMRALNRALTSGHAEVSRLVARDMGLKAGDAKAAIRSTPATTARLEVRLAASAKRIPLIKFGARQTQRGVSYNLGAGGGGRKVMASAFITTVRAGNTGEHQGVFMRKSKKRLPIDQKFGPSIGGVMARYRQQGIAKMREAFEARLTHELKFAATEK